MNIGLGQILIIIFVGILLFGNFPSLLKDLAIGIKNFKETLKIPDSFSDKKNKFDKNNEFDKKDV